MNKYLVKATIIGNLFKDGAVAQLTDEGTLSVAAGAGIYQGLKYKGSIVNGVKGGVATLGVLAIVNGTKNVIANKDKLK